MQFSVAPWAEVWVGEERIGTTPPELAPLTLPAGAHTIRFRNPDFPERTTTLYLAAGETLVHSVSLWAEVALLNVEVVPWADVLLDGTLRDTTPLERPLILFPGRHALTLRHPQFGAFDTTLTVAAGDTLQLQKNLAL